MITPNRFLLRASPGVVITRLAAAGRLAFRIMMLTLAGAVAGSGQAQTPRPTFEVASVKPISPEDGVGRAGFEGLFPQMSPGMINAARVSMENRSLTNLICTAYRVKQDQVLGPAWMSSVRFDVDAKIPEGSSRSQVPEMLQVLLEERFNLKLHRERRVRSAYALVVAKEGPKLKSHEEPARSTSGGAGSDLKRPAMPRPQGGLVHNQYANVTLGTLSEILSGLLHWPVVDMTELGGRYDVGMDIAVSDMPGMARMAGRPDDTPGPSVFDAVEKLGLRLESRRLPLEVIVVDQVAKAPTPN